jgi:pilus assembly protein CpaF
MDATMIRKEIYLKSFRFFFKPILELLDNPEVTEIMILGHETIYFERAGKLNKSDLRFPSEGFLMAAVKNIGEYAGRIVGPVQHSMDARLPEGSRVHVIIPPSSRVGVCVTIRKFQKSVFQMSKMVEKGSLSHAAAEFLSICVRLHKNIVVSGGTGTGKTSLLNALSASIPATERIIVIEDTSELQLAQPHTVYLEAQHADEFGAGAVSIRDLFVDSLRMRPDRIVVGEVRRGEALDLVQSMISGHAGSLTTVHASTPRDAAVRLETLCLMSDVSMPPAVARMLVASAVHIVVQLSRFPDGSRKVVRIAEGNGLGPDGQYGFTDLFTFQAKGIDAEERVVGDMAWTGKKPSFQSELAGQGLRGAADLSKELFL